MKFTRRLALASLAAFLLLPLARALSPLPSPLGVGDRIPDTTVRKVDGEAVKVRELVSDAPAVLVFYRGGWCPYCVRHLGALAEIEEKIVVAGHRLYGISPDRPEKLRAKPELSGLRYTLLSDSSAQTIRGFHIGFRVPDELVSKYKNEYGIDLEADSGQTHHLLPHPAVYVVDREGVIRFAHVDSDYKKRLEPEKILAALRK